MLPVRWLLRKRMGMEKWYISAKKADFNKIAQEFHISPVTARLMRNRDLIAEEEMRQYLYGNLSDLPNPHLLKDADRGAEILKEKILEGKKIRIISDYDADGVSSNYILYRGLKRCGADVDYKIPDRVEDGYGINEHLISQAFEEGIDTIVTCDNGIAASSQISYGKNLGITFVVTDHHDIPYQEDENGKIHFLLPDADAVINPKRADCPYPSKNICGAVVACKFIQVLYDYFQIDWREMEEFLEITAVATVCDVMPLTGENRILVKEGLKRMQNTGIPGLKALIEENGLGSKKITAYHLGFVLGPCINASGRLASAKDALDLLLCTDPLSCTKKAKKLKELNEERKQMTSDGVEEAKKYLTQTGHSMDKVLIVYLPDCHESIAGIIAGRIREYYNRPTFVITKTKEGLKGSGRSIEGYHMYREMTKVKECFDKYGGHPMAAGLSMREEKLEEFRDKINKNSTLTDDDFIPKVHIDLALPVSYLSENLLKEFELLEPFGNGNGKPLFAQRGFIINGCWVLGEAGTCLKLFLSDDRGQRITALYFGDTEGFFEELEAFCGKEEAIKVKKGISKKIAMDVTYYPQINEWRGQKSIEIVIKNFRFKER